MTFVFAEDCRAPIFEEERSLGDTVTIDIESRTLNVDLSADEIEDRLRGWTDPVPRYATGVMAKYAALVSSASEGAVTDAKLAKEE